METVMFETAVSDIIFPLIDCFSCKTVLYCYTDAVVRNLKRGVMKYE